MVTGEIIILIATPVHGSVGGSFSLWRLHLQPDLLCPCIIVDDPGADLDLTARAGIVARRNFFGAWLRHAPPSVRTYMTIGKVKIELKV